MLNVILCGAPGSGKGTQSDFIVKKYGLQHLSTGDVLRAEIKSGSALGKEIDAIISKGELVPDAKMIDLIDNFIENLLKKHNMSAVMLDMFVEEEEIIQRLLNRGKTSGRADDNYETIKQRLQVYKDVTKPVATYYLHNNNYFAINGNNTMEDTFAQIDNILQRVQ